MFPEDGFANPATRPINVLFPEPDEPNQCRDRAEHRFKRDAAQYPLTGLVLEGDIFEAHVSQNTIELHNALRIDVFRLLFGHFMHPVQPCKGLRDLSTDADHHEHGHNHKTKVQCESKEIADSHLAGQNQTASAIMTVMLTIPISKVDARPIIEVANSVLRTFSKRRNAPASNTAASRSSA